MYGFGFSDVLTARVCKKFEKGSPYWRARRQRERTSLKHSWQVVSAVTINCKEHFVFKAFSAFTKEKTLLNKYRRGTPLILNSGGFFPFEFCLETYKSGSWVLVSGVIHCLTNMGVQTLVKVQIIMWELLELKTITEWRFRVKKPSSDANPYPLVCEWKIRCKLPF